MNKKGFTLAELAIVVIIIALLAAIGFPIYQRTTEKAIASEMIKMARTVMGAEKAFAAERALKDGLYLYSLNLEALNIDTGVTRDATTGAYLFKNYYLTLIASEGDENDDNTTKNVTLRLVDNNERFLITASTMLSNPGIVVCAQVDDDRICRSFGELAVVGENISTEDDTLLRINQDYYILN